MKNQKANKGNDGFTSVKIIGEETEGAKYCKHNWKIYEAKTWWNHIVFLYCSKCGSWRKLL